MKSTVMQNVVISIINQMSNIKNNNLDEYTELSKEEFLLLANNGCRFKDEYKVKDCDIDGTYHIHFITGAIGNEKNVAYDFIDIQYEKIFVIFIDCFKNIITNDSTNEVDNIIGNSNYFFDLRKIFEMIYLSYCNPATVSNDFSTTVFGRTFRVMPVIFAAMVLNVFKKITEEDVEGCGIDYEYIVHALTTIKLDYLMLGITRDDANE